MNVALIVALSLLTAVAVLSLAALVTLAVYTAVTRLARPVGRFLLWLTGVDLLVDLLRPARA